VERFVDWFFRNHATGEIAVAQFPNAPLWAYFVLTIARLITHPSGGAGTAISVAATVALLFSVNRHFPAAGRELDRITQ
jgi:hypothetical protein